MLQHISATQFKMHCLRLVDEVQMQQEEIILTKHRKPIAKLVPIKKSPSSRPLFGCMKDQTQIVGDILSPLNMKWDSSVRERYPK